MGIELSEDQWGPIDEGILRCEIIKNMKAIRETAGVSLREAMDLYYERYEMLRQSRASEFICDHEEYWKNFYS
jgi:hypothetical protein